MRLHRRRGRLTFLSGKVSKTIAHEDLVVQANFMAGDPNSLTAFAQTWVLKRQKIHLSQVLNRGTPLRRGSENLTILPATCKRWRLPRVGN